MEEAKKENKEFKKQKMPNKKEKSLFFMRRTINYYYMHMALVYVIVFFMYIFKLNRKRTKEKKSIHWLNMRLPVIAFSAARKKKCFFFVQKH